MRRLKHYILGLLFLIWVSLFLARIPLPLQQSSVFLAVNGILIVGAIIWAGKKLYQGVRWHWPPFANYFGLYIAMRIVWLVFAPMPLYGSLDKVIANVILFLIFVFFLQHFEDWRTGRAWENALISMAIIYAGFELLLAFLWVRNWWSATGLIYSWPPIGTRIFGGLLEHPNVMSGFLNLVIPIVLTRWIVGKKRDRKIVWTLVLMLFMIIQYFTSSRGGWISGMAGIAITLGLLYFPEILDGNLKYRVKEVFTPSRVVLLVVTSVILSFGFISLLSAAAAAPGHGGRLDIWASALRVWEENWMLGQGTGAFQVNYAQVIQAPPGFTAERAHSIVFQIGTEHGLVGLTLTIFIILMGAMSWLRAWRASPKDKRDVLAAYAGVGAAVVTHNMGDFLLGSTVYTTGVLLILARVIVCDPYYISHRLSAKRMGVLLFSAAAVLVIGFAVTFPGVQKYNLGVTDGMDSDWQAARENICEVADNRAAYSFYQFQCGLASANLYYSGEYNISLLQDSAKYYQQGLELDDYWPVHWANLAMLTWQLGDNNAAIEIMQRVVISAPRNVSYEMQLGWMAELDGNEELAKTAYIRALEKTPWLTQSDYFTITLLRVEVRDSKDFALFVGGSERLTFQAYQDLIKGNLVQANELLREAIVIDPLNVNANALLGVVLDRLGQPDEAWIQIQAALLIEVTPQILGWASQVAISQGRENENAELLMRAFARLSFNIDNSEKYYAGVYHRYFLPVEHVPGFQRPDLLPELVDGLHWLVEYYLEKGDIENAGEIVGWLESSGWYREAD